MCLLASSLGYPIALAIWLSGPAVGLRGHTCPMNWLDRHPRGCFPTGQRHPSEKQAHTSQGTAQEAPSPGLASPWLAHLSGRLPHPPVSEATASTTSGHPALSLPRVLCAPCPCPRSTGSHWKPSHGLPACSSTHPLSLCRSAVRPRQ